MRSPPFGWYPDKRGVFVGIFMYWMGKPGAMKALRAARELLETATPLKTDCGRLCDKSCCQSDETGENGMVLFPYEERFYRKAMEDFPLRLIPDGSVVKGGVRLVCEGHCPRERRPLACRLFPLRLRVSFGESGTCPTAIPEIDPRSRVLCPLAEQARLNAMDPAFIAAANAAGVLLVKNIFHLEFLVREQALLDNDLRL